MPNLNKNDQADHFEDDMEKFDRFEIQRREPVFNLPFIITLFSAILLAIHAVRVWFLSPEQDTLVIYALAFIPASYGEFAADAPFPLSGLWSPFTYTLLHADWTHLFMNVFWMLAFGTPVAKRFGPLKFIALTVLCAMSGALLHYLTFDNGFIPVIGASGAVSGYMGCAARFAFTSMRANRGFQYDGPALSLIESFTNRPFLIFFAVWMAMNFLFGAGFVPIAGEDINIAWQAHIGGFIAGIFLFSVFEKTTIPTKT